MQVQLLSECVRREVRVITPSQGAIGILEGVEKLLYQPPLLPLFIELGIILIERLFLGPAIHQHPRLTLAFSRFQRVQILPLGTG